MSSDKIDISSIIPINMYSTHFIPFWLLTFSKFLLFLTHNMIGALATTLFGRNGAMAMTIMYIFFIAGNFVAPSALTLARNNTALLMFATSLIYTSFAFISTFIIIVQTTNATTPLLSSQASHTLFYLISAITGLAGGCIWIGYGVLNIDLGESISTRVLDDYMSSHLLSPQISPETASQLLREAITGKIMSIGWSLLSFNTVIGGLLTFAILHGGFHQPVAPLSADSMSDLVTNGSKYKLLFVIFSIISVLANVSYYALYKVYSREMAEEAESDANSPQHDNNDIKLQDPIVGKEAGSNEESKGLLSQPSRDDAENYGSVSGTSSPISSQGSQGSRKGKKSMTHWQLFIDLMKTPYVILSLIQYIFLGTAFNFVFASYCANTVKNTLGVDKVALVVTVAYTANTIVSGFVVGDLISTHQKARLWGIIGTVIQLMVPFLPLFFRESLPNSAEAWASMIFVATAAGCGDAISSSALTTAMSSDIRVDLSLCAQRYAGKDELFPDIKSILYSIYSATKSIGVFSVFLFSGTLSYTLQCQIILALGIASIVVQYFLYQRLKQTLTIPLPTFDL